MSKVLYLVILFIIDAHAWDLRIVGLSYDSWILLELGYLFIGFLFYGKMENFKWFSNELKYFWWWIFGIVLSIVSPYYIFDQAFSQSLITYRGQLLLFLIPVLFKISPTKEEVIKSLIIFSVGLWIIYLIRSINPLIINYDEETIEKIKKGAILLLPCWTIMMFVAAYFLQLVKEDFSLKSAFMVFSCFAFAFLLQNRSMLFSVSTVIVWTVLCIQHKNKWLIVLTLLIVALAVAYSTIDVWASLFEETTVQVEDEEYNRNKAYRYFLFEASPNIWCYVFGNGILSAHTTSLLQDMMKEGIYNSDVGFIGYWNRFGIIPIIVFLLLLIPAVRKTHSYFIRCSATIILMCSLTSSYFESYMRLHFCLFYYLYFVDLKEQYKLAEIKAPDEIVET